MIHREDDMEGYGMVWHEHRHGIASHCASYRSIEWRLREGEGGEGRGEGLRIRHMFPLDVSFTSPIGSSGEGRILSKHTIPTNDVHVSRYR